MTRRRLMMVLIAIIIGYQQPAASQNQTPPSYNYDAGNYFYDGNYVLPSVEASSYPAGYIPKFYYLPGSNHQKNTPSSINRDGVPEGTLNTPIYKPPTTPPTRSIEGFSYSKPSTPSDAKLETAISGHENGHQAHNSLEEGPWQPLAGILSEIRLGAGRHDSAVVGRRKENGVDLDAELLFASPSALDYLWSPRPTIGVHANITRKKNTSQLYGGLTWEWWPLEPVFINFFFGFSYHNGKINSADPQVKSLGSLWLFRESLSIGWQSRSGFNISVYLDHASNGTLLAKRNQGIDTLGGRLGYRF